MRGISPKRKEKTSSLILFSFGKIHVFPKEFVFLHPTMGGIVPVRVLNNSMT
jgi:hypothetical protein